MRRLYAVTGGAEEQLSRGTTTPALPHGWTRTHTPAQAQGLRFPRGSTRHHGPADVRDTSGCCTHHRHAHTLHPNPQKSTTHKHVTECSAFRKTSQSDITSAMCYLGNVNNFPGEVIISLFTCSLHPLNRVFYSRWLFRIVFIVTKHSARATSNASYLFRLDATSGLVVRMRP